MSTFFLEKLPIFREKSVVRFRDFLHSKIVMFSTQKVRKSLQK